MTIREIFDIEQNPTVDDVPRLLRHIGAMEQAIANEFNRGYREATDLITQLRSENERLRKPEIQLDVRAS